MCSHAGSPLPVQVTLRHVDRQEVDEVDAPLPGSASGSAGSSSTGREHHGRISNVTDHTLVPTAPRKLKKKLLEHARDATDQTVVPHQSAAERQRQDVISPIYDQLKRKPLWWILEILPTVESYQDQNGTWHRRVRYE